MARQTAATAPVQLAKRRGPIRWRRWLGLSIPGLIALVLLVAGVGADWLETHDPEFLSLADRLQPPVFDGGSWDHVLGTDDLGRDIFRRLLHGARISLIVVFIVVPGAALVGTLIGLIAGWVGGLTGQLLMRLVDVQLALPAILFAVLLASLVGPSLRNVIIILLIWTWPSYARLVRADVLSLKERDFVTASRAVGAGPAWIMRKHLFPECAEHRRGHHDAGGRARDPGGGRAEFPQCRRAGGDVVVGADDLGGPRVYERRLVADLAAGPGAADDRADREPDGRLAARRARSAAAERALGRAERTGSARSSPLSARRLGSPASREPRNDENNKGETSREYPGRDHLDGPRSGRAGAWE